MPPHPTSWRNILILSSHLRLGLPTGLLPLCFPTKTLYMPARPRTQHDCHHNSKLKPEAVTAIIELLMMGGRTHETCWAVNKRQDNKLKNCCIRLVIYLNCSHYSLVCLVSPSRFAGRLWFLHRFACCIQVPCVRVRRIGTVRAWGGSWCLHSDVCWHVLSSWHSTGSFSPLYNDGRKKNNTTGADWHLSTMLGNSSSWYQKVYHLRHEKSNFNAILVLTANYSYVVTHLRFNVSSIFLKLQSSILY
jgi:hypothetical protein